MKKILFYFLVTSFYSLPSFAQDFVEEDLIGTWELVESSGDFVAEASLIANIQDLSRQGKNVGCAKTLTFYSNEKQAEKVWRLGVSKYITDKNMENNISMNDYFLYTTAGGGLRLHIQYQKDGTPTNQTVRYIVMSITQNQIEIMTYDKKGTATYRREGTSSVRGVNATGYESENYYSLTGRKTSELTKGINVVQQKDGTTKKVLVK